MQKTPIWILIATSILIGALGLALRGLLLPADRAVLALFLKIPDAYTGSNTPLTFIFLFLQIVPAVLIGLHLSKIPRFFALLQLFTGITLAQCAASACRPFSTLLVVALAGATGYFYRRENLRIERFEAQRYELLLRNKELQETRMQMVHQDEVERRLLAADLQDQVLSDLKTLAGKFESYAQSRDTALVPGIQSLLQQSMGEIREVMDSLCPSALEHLGLPAALEDCCRRAGERGEFKVRFKNNADEELIDRLDMVEKSLLYRLVQESLTNICKHAGAKVVRAALESSNGALEIKITDDGKGIDQDKLRSPSRGLRLMRQRADLIGATIAWQSGDDGKGTAVTIRLSLANLDGNESTDS